MSWKIYHNPNCSKSRAALALLEKMGVQHEVREYLKHPLTEAELLELQGILLGDFQELVRTGDEAFKARPFALDNPKVIARELAACPALLERPVVINEKGAVVARPLEKLEKLV